MKQEEEYHDNRETVSRVATVTLRKLLAYLDGKRVGDLAGVSSLGVDLKKEDNAPVSLKMENNGDEHPYAKEIECLKGDAMRYEMRGVSADKKDVHAAIEKIDKG